MALLEHFKIGVLVDNQHAYFLSLQTEGTVLLSFIKAEGPSSVLGISHQNIFIRPWTHAGDDRGTALLSCEKPLPFRSGQRGQSPCPALGIPRRFGSLSLSRLWALGQGIEKAEAGGPPLSHTWDGDPKAAVPAGFSFGTGAVIISCPSARSGPWRSAPRR